jgi:hypothetical protein
VYERKRYAATFNISGSYLNFCRMNVAITRAKELLIVIGSAAILQQDPFWRSFLQFTLRNKLCGPLSVRSVFFLICGPRTRYSGPPLDLELDGNYVSRLESVIFMV